MSKTSQPSTTEADLAVVGAGAAGLYAALCAAREGARVVLISATPLAQTASYWAQGGLAAALAADDTPELHLSDTERAGRALVRHSAAEILVREAPACVEDLQSLGVRFDADRFGRLALGLEGGHSIRRIVHAGGSATGRRLVRQLSALAAEDPRIAVLEGARARALWKDPGLDGAPGAGARCRGLLCEDWRNGPGGHPGSGGERVISARAVVLATGGAAALWARTTNPPGSQGAGLLLAHAAGALLADLELLQFHPTAIIGVPGREGFLVTEAIRGEGATLHDARTGERFVDELLPRDEVSRAIQARLRETGASSVGLDMRGIDPAHFPNVVAALREAGLDPARELVPVAPAATMRWAGSPSICTRARASPVSMPSARSPARACTAPTAWRRTRSASASSSRDAPSAPPSPSPPQQRRRQGRSQGWRRPRPLPVAQTTTRTALWRDAGIERTGEGLRRLLSDPHPLARLIASCALAREESRGAHLRLDHPQRNPALDHRHALVSRDEQVGWETWR